MYTINLFYCPYVQIFAFFVHMNLDMYNDTSKHLYDITILSQTKEIKALLKNKSELKKLISYKRREESNRKGGIDSNIRIEDFLYWKREFNKDLIKEFENMQNKYILKDEYKIDIVKIKNTLKRIKGNFIT